MTRMLPRLLAILTLISLCGTAQAEPRPALEVRSAGGESLTLEPEELSGLTVQPLLSVKKTLDDRYGPDFLTLRKLTLKTGTELVGRTVMQKAPVRITVYEISKQRDGERKLRVAASWFRATPGETSEFHTKVEAMEEQVFLVTAENVGSADQLNQHLSYMNTQDNAVTLTGYSTNWNFSALKLKLVGKDRAQSDESFTKDALWLVEQLIKPEWVVSVRIVAR